MKEQLHHLSKINNSFMLKMVNFSCILHKMTNDTTTLEPVNTPNTAAEMVPDLETMSSASVI